MIKLEDWNSFGVYEQRRVATHSLAGADAAPSECLALVLDTSDLLLRWCAHMSRGGSPLIHWLVQRQHLVIDSGAYH